MVHSHIKCQATELDNSHQVRSHENMLCIERDAQNHCDNVYAVSVKSKVQL